MIYIRIYLCIGFCIAILACYLSTKEIKRTVAMCFATILLWPVVLCMGICIAVKGIKEDVEKTSDKKL